MGHSYDIRNEILLKSSRNRNAIQDVRRDLLDLYTKTAIIEETAPTSVKEAFMDMLALVRKNIARFNEIVVEINMAEEKINKNEK